MKMNPKLLMVALGEEEIAQKAAKTGFWEHGFWGQTRILGTGQLIPWQALGQLGTGRISWILM